MAITKVFINTDDSNFYNFLSEYATPYFDSIVDSSSQITCKIGDDLAYIYDKTSVDSRHHFCAKSGSDITFEGNKPSYAVATSKGILIHCDVSNYSPTDIFISKTSSGSVGFAIFGVCYAGGSYYKRFYCYDFDNSSSISSYVSTTENTSNYCFTILSPLRWNLQKTSFAYIPCIYTDSHLDGVYQLVANQYYNVAGTITDSDGHKYFTNGCLALAE